LLVDAIGAVLPSALAVALSPFPVVAVILVLGSRHARTSGPLFALGWVVGLSVLSTVVVLVLSGAGADDPDSAAASGVGGLQVGLGLGLLVLAARKWRTRPRPGNEVAMPGWMASVDGAGPGRALGLGLGLAAGNPKNIALTMAASASIAEIGLDGADTVTAVAAFVAVGSASVVGAVLYRLLRAERAAAGLDSVKAFMVANNAVIMMVILLAFGVKLIGDGLAGV
jgi:threonine/homoserine/homoserine lactone efflux protein